MPAGWSTTAPVVCDASVEIFVLTGTVRIGSESLRPGHYAYHPAGSPLGEWAATSNATALFIFDATPHFRTVAKNALRSDSNCIAHLDTWAMQWGDPLAASEPTEDYRTGVMVKVLRLDPNTGASTHLAGLMPGWFMPGTEEHPVSEENFCLLGDVHIGVVDRQSGYTMTRGTYLGRPSGVVHGPIVTKNGNINFCKTHGRLGIKYAHHPDAAAIIENHLVNYPWE
jgi:hypothetical protein